MNVAVQDAVIKRMWEGGGLESEIKASGAALRRLWKKAYSPSNAKTYTTTRELLVHVLAFLRRVEEIWARPSARRNHMLLSPTFLLPVGRAVVDLIGDSAALGCVVRVAEAQAATFPGKWSTSEMAMLAQLKGEAAALRGDIGAAINEYVGGLGGDGAVAKALDRLVSSGAAKAFTRAATAVESVACSDSWWSRLVGSATVSPETARELLSSLGSVLFTAGHLPAASLCFARARALALDCEDAAAAAECAVSLAEVYLGWDALQRPTLYGSPPPEDPRRYTDPNSAYRALKAPPHVLAEGVSLEACPVFCECGWVSRYVVWVGG